MADLRRFCNKLQLAIRLTHTDTKCIPHAIKGVCLRRVVILIKAQRITVPLNLIDNDAPSIEVDVMETNLPCVISADVICKLTTVMPAPNKP